MMGVGRDGRGRRRILLMTALLPAALSLHACGPQIAHPSPRSPALVPTIVGVVDHQTSDLSAIVLTDGRTVPYLASQGIELLGGGAGPGDLLLASMDSPRFVDALDPLEGESGCWDAWPAQVDQPIVWDLGDAIELGDGVELPKAPHFAAGAGTQVIDGRRVWINNSQATKLYRLCANSAGQIDWLKPID